MNCPYKYIDNHPNIFLDRLDFNHIDGICTKIGNNYYIGVRKGLSNHDERIVIAHELGHIIHNTTHITDDPIVENEADRFARDFLISKKILNRLIRKEQSVTYLANYFNVSVDIMIVRITELFHNKIIYET